MPASPRVCIKTVRLCVLTAEAQGLDPRQLLGEYGLTPASLDDPYARVPHALAARLWEEIPARTGDGAFGIHAAERWHAQTLDAFDGALRHCESLGAIFQLLARYVRLLHEAGTIELTRQGDTVRITEHFAAPAVIPRHFGELIMAMWVLRSRRAVGPAFALREVGFAHGAPPDLGEHRRVLGAPLRFGAGSYSILVDARSLDAKVPGAEPMMGLVLQRHLHDELGRLPPPDDFLAAAEQAAREALRDPALDISRMARRLHTSQRTLQRRLQLCGTSFQQLIEKARREQALQLLRDPRLALAEVAFMTGYSEMSTFHRAFRRWTGQTPGEYRSSQSSRR
jgi:AraC-like DNA-binding protein